VVWRAAAVVAEASVAAAAVLVPAAVSAEGVVSAAVAESAAAQGVARAEDLPVAAAVGPSLAQEEREAKGILVEASQATVQPAAVTTPAGMAVGARRRYHATRP
jgi:hypothetical protein